MLDRVLKACARSLLFALVAAAAARAFAAEPAKPDEGFVSLFDGKTLSGWKAEHTDKFSARDGVILQNGGLGWLRADKDYGDFELRLEFRFVKPGSDSGILVRSSRDSVAKPPHWPAKAYQIQLIDGPSQAAVFGHGAAKPKVSREDKTVEKARKPAGQWQTLAVKAVGHRLEILLNGTLVTTSDDLQLLRGHVGLQGEEGVLEFRNIRIKELTTK